VNEKLENGFEFDNEAIDKILNRKADDHDSIAEAEEEKKTETVIESRLTRQSKVSTNDDLKMVEQAQKEGKQPMLSSIEI